MRRLLIAAALATALSACGGSSGGALEDQSGATHSSDAPATQGPVAGSGCTSDAKGGTVTAMTDLSKKPVIEVPDGPMPCNLDVQDIVTGKGAAAKAGDHLTMKYVGVLYADGKQFDASWDNGQDFDFDLGTGSVIAGWDQGLVGMRVGGRRQLIIPPQLGYGDRGAGADIPPGATLIFVVDLVKIS